MYIQRDLGQCLSDPGQTIPPVLYTVQNYYCRKVVTFYRLLLIPLAKMILKSIRKADMIAVLEQSGPRTLTVDAPRRAFRISPRIDHPISRKDVLIALVPTTTATGTGFKTIFLHDETIFLTRVCSYDLDYAPTVHTNYSARLRRPIEHGRPKCWKICVFSL